MGSGVGLLGDVAGGLTSAAVGTAIDAGTGIVSGLTNGILGGGGYY